MQPNNKIKSSVSIAVLAVFIVGLIVGFASRQNRLVTPVSAAVSASSINSPTVVDRTNAVVSFTPVSNVTGYIVNFYPIVNGVVGSQVVASRTINSNTCTSTSCSYKVSPTDNLSDNAKYAFTVTSTLGSRMSAPSVPAYFMITPAVNTTAKTSSVLINPTFYVSDNAGNVYQYSTGGGQTGWLKVNNTSAPVTSTGVYGTQTGQTKTVVPTTNIVTKTVNAVVNFFSNIFGGSSNK